MGKDQLFERNRSARWDIVALALGFAGGVLGSLTIFTVAHLPKDMEKHALLSGPFLAFIALIMLVAIFHRPLRQLLTQGNLTLSWGDKTISIHEIEENFDQELEARLESLASEVEELRELIFQLPDGGQATENGPEHGASFREGALDRISEAFRIKSKDLASIIYHLGTSKYKWRNQHTLAKRTELSASEIDETARTAPELIVRGRGKSGNAILRLTDSAKLDFSAVIAPST